MAETVITCPSCGCRIPLSEALSAQLRGQLQAAVQAEHEARLREAVAAAEARAESLVSQAEQRARDAAALELKLLNEQLVEQRQRAAQAQQAELDLRRRAAELEERQRTFDLELARRLDEERRRLEEGIRKAAAEEQSLQLKQKEKQIEDLRKALEDAKRRSELGSQELQGEVLELDIQAALERQFPADRIEPVLKGARGADIVQRVRNERLEECGVIVWETKNTKNWSPAWIAKLKEDQRAMGATLAALVSVALPDGIDELGRVEGVWVTGRSTYLALATALREQLIQVSFARLASEGKNEKMELLYQYLSGDEFRQRVEAIVEAFTAMQAQLAKERRAMEKQWAEREKQIQRVIGSTTGMYGALQGIVGGALAAIPALELEETPLLTEGDAADRD